MKKKNFNAASIAVLCLGLAGPAMGQNGSPAAAKGPEQPAADQAARDKVLANPAAPAEPSATKAVTEMNKVSHLLGMKVENGQSQNLGEVKDVVFDIRSGMVSYVVMAVAPSAATSQTRADTATPSENSPATESSGQKLVAVPLRAFTPGPNMSHLILSADPQKLAMARGIENQWPPVSNPTWGAQPFWNEPATGTTDPALEKLKQDTEQLKQETVRKLRKTTEEIQQQLEKLDNTPPKNQ